MAIRGQTTPFGPYGGLLQGFLHPDRQSEHPERLEALGAGSGAADVEYEQFLKAKEVPVMGSRSGNICKVDSCWVLERKPLDKKCHFLILILPTKPFNPF